MELVIIIALIVFGLVQCLGTSPSSDAEKRANAYKTCRNAAPDNTHEMCKDLLK